MLDVSGIWYKQPLFQRNAHVITMPTSWTIRRHRVQAQRPVCIIFAQTSSIELFIIETGVVNSEFDCFHCFYFRWCVDHAKHLPPTSYAPSLYQDLPPIGDRKDDEYTSHYHSGFDLFSAKLGLLLPDSAPDPGVQLPEPDVQPSKCCFHSGSFVYNLLANNVYSWRAIFTEIIFVYCR